jgi:putative nucleotidyltransferase with HDIG domain
MKAIQIPPVLAAINAVFERSGFQAYLVGGAVRDLLRGKTPTDFDVATDATPEQMMRLFRRVIPTGIEHGTVTVLFRGEKIEATTFRAESGYSDSRRPDAVAFGAGIEADLSRRDFTMNAVAVSLRSGEAVDPFGGRADIQRKIIRAVGAPLARFREDGLRPVRAVRFAATLGFALEAETERALSAAPDATAAVSRERFRDEFCKMLAADKPSLGLRLMEKSGILALFIPELLECRGVAQADSRGHHQFDVLDHLFYACDGAPRENLDVRLAALLHDVGKPAAQGATQKPDASGTAQEIRTFYSHEQTSAKLARSILTRLRFPKRAVEYVSLLVARHMFHYEPSWSDAAVRRFLTRVPAGAVDDLFSLRLADIYGMTRSKSVISGARRENLIEFRERILRILEAKQALSLKDLAVNGYDLRQIGIPAGKLIGTVLNELLDAVLADPAKNTREHLLSVAGELCSAGFQNGISEF